MSDWKDEVTSKARFEFGKNWQKYLDGLGEEQVADAAKALAELLETEDLSGKSFLDIGVGSGLHSLSALRLGAERVFAFDYDENSVEAARRIRARYEIGEETFHVEQGSVLDGEYVRSLGQFDVVYSWGVLHHTGDMTTALTHADLPVKPGGILCVAIYNTQMQAPVWRVIKKLYVGSPAFLRKGMEWFFTGYFAAGLFLADLVRKRNPLARYRGPRGMRFVTDVIDWIGGYPFETAKPEEIFKFYRDRGYSLVNMVTVGGKMGCNEFVFRKG